MPSTTGVSIDDCRAQLASNIVKLSTKDPLDVVETLSTLECPGLIGMIEQYGTLSCEKTSFLQALITTISAISGSITVKNPTSTYSLPLNLFTHLIGEPGTQKSVIIRVIRHAMTQLDKLFPDVYSKFSRGQRCSMVVQSETELSLSKKMANTGDIFAICDEIDTLLAKLSVFSAGELTAAAGGKILCQGFDLIEDETRGTGPHTHTINSAKLAILGASTGEKYASNMLKFESDNGSDGVIARIGIHVVPTLPPNTHASTSVFTSISNILQCLIIIHHLAAEKVQLHFHQSQTDADNQSKPTVPEWLQNIRQQHGINSPMFQVISGEQAPLPTYTPTSVELEADGSYISASGVVCQYIEADLKAANLSNDVKLYVRSLLRKTGVKLPRYCACMNLLYHSISWCYEILDKINFVAGLHASNQELDTEFAIAAEQLVRRKVEQMPKDSQGRPIMYIPKKVVLAAIKLYNFTKQSSIDFFSCDRIERFSTERLVKSAQLKENAQQLRTNKKQSIYNEKYVLLSMKSPFILSSWLSTKTTDLNWSGKWNKSVSDGRTILTTLQECGLLREGQFIMYCKTLSFAKLTPAAIQESPDKLISLQSFGITLDEYTAAYNKMVLPSRTTLSSEGIAYVCQSMDFVPYYHLYHQKDVIDEFDKLVKNGAITRQLHDDGITRYVVTSSPVVNGITTSESNIQLSDDENNENQSVVASPNRDCHGTRVKRKSVSDDINSKRRKEDGLDELLQIK
ncbi:unnamed protein product [Rotaria magnacalcarata]|uniref:Uncharacterized protein n=2 Tax=Rotaria magnacalcarata TaxID=392030 RepID=A0A816HAG1_9BILA|nr:unnamed protein product [Rotaria magnacalcarata]CAF2118194.1 unnamed protein product [Rotaria magnacalcarata]